MIDEIHLKFSPESLFVLNLCLGFIMFGIALHLKIKDFREILLRPKPVYVGLFSQLVFLPFITIVLIYLLKPSPSLALGMILVSACPGGNVSNFLSHLAKANTALSVSLTSAITLLCVFTTPFIFTFLSGLLPDEVNYNKDFSLSFLDMFQSILYLILIPVSFGITFSHRFPRTTTKITKPIQILSLLIFMAFILIAFFNNFDFFLRFIPIIAGMVFIHNALALFGGYVLGKAFFLPENDARTISIETGIQNSGLGLVLIFNFFDGLGGMSLIAAFWGVWHLVSGLCLAAWWARRNP